jgi:hypothetical protein
MADPIVSAHIGISADSAQVEAATRRASDALRRFERAGEAAGTVVANALKGLAATMAGAFAVDRIVAFAGAAVTAAADIRRFADMAGLSTTAFQELQFALRNAGVTGEQMGAAFAAFSRNLSDLQRGTGGLLQYLRESNPQFIEQFKNVRDVNEGFTVLSRILSRAASSHDALRLAAAAGGEQMGRLAMEAARLGPRLDDARRAAHEAGRVLSEQNIKDLQDAKKAWQDFADFLTIQTGRIIAAGADAIRGPDMSRLEEQLNRARIQWESVEAVFAGLSARQRQNAENVETLTRAWTALTEAWSRFNAVAPRTRDGFDAAAEAAARTEPTWQAQTNAIRQVQLQLQLFTAQLQTVPNAAIESTRAFQEAWTRTAAVLAAQGATQIERDLARLNLAHQIDAEQQRILAGTLTAEEELQRRRTELHHAHRMEIISEAQLNKALQLAEMQRINAMVGAIGTGLQAMASAWPKQKAFAIAATTASTIQAVMKAWSEPALPWPLNAAVAGMIAAAGAKNIATLMGTNPGSSPAIPSAGGGTAPEAAPAGPNRTLTMQNWDPAGLVTGSFVERLMMTINEEQKNGTVLLVMGQRPT